MPANVVSVNGVEYVIPDSFMGPLDAYVKMVEEKIGRVTSDEEVLSDGGPQLIEKETTAELVNRLSADVSIEPPSKALELADGVMNKVSQLESILVPVLTGDDGTTPNVHVGSPLVERLEACNGHLEKLIERVNI